MSIRRIVCVASAAVFSIVLAAGAVPAQAADTVTLTGAVDFTGVAVASHVEITAYAKPYDYVAREALTSLAATSVDFTPGGASAVAFEVTVPVASAALLNFDSTTDDGLVSEWWLGSNGAIGGAYPLVQPIAVTASTSVGTVAAVRAGSIDVSLENATTQVCILRLDDTPVVCSTDVVNPTTTFHFGALYPGAYQVAAQGSTMHRDVRVSAATVTNVDFTQGGTIVGRIKDSDGKALAGVVVDTRGAERSLYYASTVTDSHGRYELTSLATGTTRLSVYDGTHPKSHEADYTNRGGFADLGGIRGSAPVKVTGVRAGKVTKAKTITLQKKGRVTARVSIAKNRTAKVFVMRGNTVFQYGDVSSHDKSISFYGNPGTYRLLVVGQDGARRFLSTKITVRAGKTTKLGTLHPKKRTATVTGRVPGRTDGSVELRTSPEPSAPVLANGKVIDGTFTVTSVAPGVYYAVTKTTVELGVSDPVKLTVKGNRSGVKLRAASDARVTGELLYNDRAISAGWMFIGGTYPNGAGFGLTGSAQYKLDLRGQFTAFPRGTVSLPVAVAGAALSSTVGETESFAKVRTPYYFELSKPSATDDQIPDLYVRGIGGA